MYKQLDNDNVKKMVMQFFEYSRNSSKRQDFLSNVYEDGYKKYLMFKQDREQALKKAEKEWRSNLFVPIAFTIIETWVPNIVNAIFSTNPPIKMKPTKHEDFLKADVAELLTNVQSEEDGLKLKFEKMIKDCGIGGLAVGCETWYHKEIEKHVVTRSRPSVDLFGRSFFLSPNEVEKEETKTVTTFDGPKFMQIDPHDWYPDHSKDNIDDMRGAGREFILYIDEVEELYNAGVFTEKGEWKKLKKDYKDGGIRREDLSGQIERRLEEFDSQIENVQGVESVLIKEYMEDNRLVYIANDKYVLRNTDNPNWHSKKHYVDIKAVEIPHQYYPKSIVWTVSDIQNAINNLWNQKADNVRFLLNNMMTVIEDEILYERDLVPRPGGRIRVKSNHNAVMPLPTDNVTQDAYQQLPELMEMSQNASGIFDIVKGQMARKETATVGSILANAAGTRLESTIQRIANTGLKRIYQMMVELDRQYLEDPKALEIIGRKDSQGLPLFKEVGRTDMPVGELSYQLTASLEQNKELERKASLDYFNLAYGKPEFDQHALSKALMEYAPFMSENSIVVGQEEYIQKMNKIMQQNMALEIKGEDGEPVIPPTQKEGSGQGTAGPVRKPGQPPVDSQAQSPEMMRKKEASMQDVAGARIKQ